MSKYEVGREQFTCGVDAYENNSDISNVKYSKHKHQLKNPISYVP